MVSRVRRYRWIEALLVFLLVVLAHRASSVVTSYDSRWFVPVALSIVHEGNTNLDEYRDAVEAAGFFGIREVDGHLYNFFPIGTTLVALPMVWFAEVTLGSGWGEDHVRAQHYERWIAAIVVGLATVFVWLIAAARLTDVGPRLVVVAAFAFATPAWSTASRALWQHGPSMMLLAAALWLVIAAERRPGVLAALGPVLALGWVVRPTNVVSAVVLLALATLRWRRWGLVSAGLALVSVIPFLAFNLEVYGRWLPPYASAPRLVLGPTFLEALAGNLVSPNRGLLVFSPVLLLAVWGVALRLRQRRFEPIEAALAATVAAHWVVVSLFPHWWGGHSLGPRLMADMVPYLVYLLVPVVGWIEAARGRPRGLAVVVVALLFTASCLIHFRCANRTGPSKWNVQPTNIDQDPGRVWDWRDLQFLR